MRAYTFAMTGGSPFNGEIVVVASRKDEAKRLAQKQIDEWNEGDYGQYSLTGECWVENVSGTTIVHANNGEC